MDNLDMDNIQQTDTTNSPAVSQHTENQSIESPLNGMDNNVLAAISYVVPPITGIIVYLTNKEDDFVRFHAVQSVLFGLAAFIAFIVANMLISVLIGLLLVPLVSIAYIILWIMMMWKSYNGEKYYLPVIGKMADDIAKTSGVAGNGMPPATPPVM